MLRLAKGKNAGGNQPGDDPDGQLNPKGDGQGAQGAPMLGRDLDGTAVVQAQLDGVLAQNFRQGVLPRKKTAVGGIVAHGAVWFRRQIQRFKADLLAMSRYGFQPRAGRDALSGALRTMNDDALVLNGQRQPCPGLLQGEKQDGRGDRDGDE